MSSLWARDCSLCSSIYLLNCFSCSFSARMASYFLLVSSSCAVRASNFLQRERKLCFNSLFSSSWDKWSCLAPSRRSSMMELQCDSSVSRICMASSRLLSSSSSRSATFLRSRWGYLRRMERRLASRSSWQAEKGRAFEERRRCSETLGLRASSGFTVDLLDMLQLQLNYPVVATHILSNIRARLVLSFLAKGRWTCITTRIVLKGMIQLALERSLLFWGNKSLQILVNTFKTISQCPFKQSYCL